MSKIHFINGNTVDITIKQFNSLTMALRNAGVRVWQNRETGDIYPLTSHSMALIERGADDAPKQEREVPAEPDTTEPVQEPVPESTDDKEEDKESAQERADRILAEMKAKNDCNANGHEGQKQLIFYQDIQTKQGASKRFFPVCEFCGGRGRYIAANKLPEEAKAAAKLWQED